MTDAAALTSLCAAVRWCYSAAAVSIAVIGDDGLTYVAADGATDQAIVGTTLRPGQGIAGFVAATGQSLTVHDLTTEPRFARDVAERIGYVPTSIQCVPFHDDAGEVAGVLSLLDRAGHARDSHGNGGPSEGPAIEWFTEIASALCRPRAAAVDPLGSLTPADRERAASVLAAVIDTLRR